MNKIKDKILEINSSLNDLCKEILNDYSEPKNKSEAILLYFLVKSKKTFNAIVTLCNGGMGEDACILSRSIFEMSIDAKYILQDKNGYLAERYFDYDWILRKKMEKNIKNKPSLEIFLNNKLDNRDCVDSDYENIQSQFDKVESIHAYKNSNTWSIQNIAEKADLVGKIDLYNFMYKIQCIISHSSVRAMNYYFKNRNGKLEIEPETNNNFIIEALVSTFCSYFELVSLMNSCLDYKYNEKLKKIENDYALLMS